QAAALDGAGGSILSFNAETTLYNSILWGGIGAVGPELYVDGWDPNLPVDVSYCDVASGQAGVYVGQSSTLNWLAGNLDANPTFEDADGPDDDPNTWDDNDYHLAIGSPCVNAGDPAYIMQWAYEPDIDGELRVQKCVIDIGSDELKISGSPSGDADEDTDVDLSDFMQLQQCCEEAIDWNCLTTYDFDSSCLIDEADLMSFVARFSGPGVRN
ncbi:MAG: hypothetical protein JXO22_02350, partial [Phycisphaerae bacterium]|nr:hypothetical protein [Phycisphaerae bacterium]